MKSVKCLFRLACIVILLVLINSITFKSEAVNLKGEKFGKVRDLLRQNMVFCIDKGNAFAKYQNRDCYKVLVYDNISTAGIADEKLRVALKKLRKNCL